MKDIDFDELDRAVASAISDNSGGTAENSSTPGAPPTDTSTQQQVQSEVAVPSSSVSAHAVHSRMMPSNVPTSRAALTRHSASPLTTHDDTADLPQSPVVEEPQPSTQPPQKHIPHRAGRFMDVMRPSQSTQSVSSVAASRTATASVPAVASAAAEPTTTPPDPDLETAINELLVSEGHAPVQPTETTETTEPAVENQIAAEASQADEVIEPTVAPESDQASVEAIAAELGKVSDADEAVAPAATPFLPDAKVDKRPLGGMGGSASADVEADTTQSEAVVTPEVPGTASPEMSATTEPVISSDAVTLEAPAAMPEELQGDIVAVESVDTGAESESATQPATTLSDAPAAEEAPAVTSGPTSIARQYKEQPKIASEEDESGAIFDPQTYQQPIEHPAKKSSGWIWVLAILGIILLAIGVAVALWFSGILPVSL